MEFDLSKLDEHIKQYQEKMDYLNHVAVSLDSDTLVEGHPSEKQIHNLIVLYLSSHLPVSFDYLLEYIHYNGLEPAMITKHLVNVCQNMPNVAKKLDNDEAVRFPVLQAAAFLQTMNAEIVVILKDGRREKIKIDSASAVDLLYDNGISSVSASDWITHIFEVAHIHPETVEKIKPYPQSLMLFFDPNKFTIIDYLATRFQKIFQYAVIFLRVINETTQFSPQTENLYKKWKNSTRFAMTSKSVVALPIIHALLENYAPFELFFRDPVVSRGDMLSSAGFSGSKHNRAYLPRIKNVTDEIIALIVDVFFEKEFSEGFGTYYFLRKKPEMLERLSRLSSQDETKIADSNFLDYLSAMGYPELTLNQSEYLGVHGLKKAVEFHSLSHISFGAINVDLYPPFVSG